MRLDEYKKRQQDLQLMFNGRNPVQEFQRKNPKPISAPPQLLTTEMLYNPNAKPKTKYTDADFAPYGVKWQFQWSDPYNEADYTDQLRKMRNLPPASVLRLYDFEDDEDVKRFKNGLPPAKMEAQQKLEQAKRDVDFFLQERQRRFEEILKQKQSEIDAANSSFFGKLFPKEIEYIRPEEYTPELPQSLKEWLGYLQELEEYKEKLENMDTLEKAYKASIGTLPKEPQKPGFDLSDYLKVEDLEKDLWEEFIKKQQQQVQQPSQEQVLQPMQQQFPGWKQQSPTITGVGGKPLGTQPAPTPAQPTPAPNTGYRGISRPAGGTVNAQPDLPKGIPASYGGNRDARQILYDIGKIPAPAAPVAGPGFKLQIPKIPGNNTPLGDFLAYILNEMLNPPIGKADGQKLEVIPVEVIPSAETIKRDIEALREGIKKMVTDTDPDKTPTWGEVLKNMLKSGFAQWNIGIQKAGQMLMPGFILRATGMDEQSQQFIENMEKWVTEAEKDMEGASQLKDLIYTGGSAAIPTTIDMLLGKVAATGLNPSMFGPLNLERAVYNVSRSAPFFARSFGSYARESELEGADVGQQYLYGLAGALTETITEMPIIDRIYGGVVNKLPVKALMKTGAKKLFTNTAGQLAVQAIYNAGLEAGQEMLAGFVSTMAKKGIYNPDVPWVGEGGVIDASRIGEDAYGGMAMSLVMTALGLPSNYRSYKQAATIMQKAQNNEKITVDDLLTLQELAMEDLTDAESHLDELNRVTQYAAKESEEVDKVMNTPITETFKQAQEQDQKAQQPQQPKAQQAEKVADKSPGDSYASLIGKKVILKGLGEVDVLSETDTHVKVRTASGKEIDVLKTVFSKVMETGNIPSKASTSPVEPSNVPNVQTQGQAQNQPDTAKFESQTSIIESEPISPAETASSIVRINPADIKVDPKRFQFKTEVDAKTGAGKSLDIEKWDENLAGIVLVWEDNNGNRYIVNGHHRLQKAKELGVDGINAMIIREADGYSDKDAKLLGAKINIAEGHGSLVDAAKLFREGGYTIEQLKAEGLPMKSGNAQKGYALAQLTDNLFQKVIDKVITEAQGAIIGEKLPSDGGINDARQEFILKQLMSKDMSNRVLEETIDAIKSVDATSYTQETLFGTELIFNTADFEIKPKIIAETKRIISSDKNAFAKIVRNAESLKRVGNILQDETNLEQKNTLELALELIDKMKYAKGDQIANVFNKATSSVQAGGSVKEAAEKAAKEIVNLISDGEYIQSLMGNTSKAVQSGTAEEIESDVIPGQMSLLGDEPVQTEEIAPKKEQKPSAKENDAYKEIDSETNNDRSDSASTRMKEGVISVEKPGISQSKDSQDSAAVSGPAETGTQTDAGRNLETEKQPKQQEVTLYHGSPINDLTKLKIGTWVSPVKEFAYAFANKSKNPGKVYEITADLSKMKIADISSVAITDYVTIPELSNLLGVSENELQEAYNEDVVLSTIDRNTPSALRYILDQKPIEDFLISKGYDAIKAKEGLKSPTDYVDTYKILNDKYLKLSTNKQAADALSDYDLTINKTTTKNGTPVWELKGVKQGDTDLINVMKKFKGRWYAPKKAWSFYQDEDPTPNILAEIEKVRPKNQGTKSAQEAKAAETATKEPATAKSDTEDKYMGFKEGDKVSFVSKNGETLTGRITSISDYSSISPDIGVAATVNIDQIKSAGGVPIYRKEVVSLKKLTKVEEAPTDTNSQNQGINSLEDNATTRDFDDWVVRFVILDSADWLKDAVINTDKETLMPEIIKRVKDGVTEKLTSYQKSIPQEVISWYDSRMANDGNNKYIKGMAEEIYNEAKGASADVRTSDQTKSERMSAETVPTSSSDRATGGLSGSQRAGGSREVRSSGEDVSGSVSRAGGVRGESAEKQLDSGNDNKAGTGGDTSSRRGRNVTHAGNFRITEDMQIGSGGLKTKYKNNVEAIKLLKQLEAENRKATPEEQKVLAQYVGWGGMPQAFDESNKSWANEYRELRDLLTDDEYKAARASTPNAHYTDISVIRAMYDAVQRLGFDGGKILEPAVGSGNFIGAAPDALRSSKFTGVELDSITGRIASQLYQDANIHIKGFEEVKFPDNFFDLAISNVPFGDYKVYDPKYSKHNFLIHDYFFAKTLDKVRPGGIVAFITSKGTMDKKNSAVRQYISERADLIGAIRLPNTTFQKNANTSVTTDIIFLQKRSPGQPAKGESWLNVGKTADGVPVNEYYLNHPEMMLGTMAFDSSMYGNETETTLNPLEGDLTQALKQAIEKLPQNIMVQAEQQSEVDAPDFDNLAADNTLKEDSYVLKDGQIYQNVNGILQPVTQKHKGQIVPVSGKRKERIIGMIRLKNALREVFDTQRRNADEATIKAARDKLNKAYDDFVKRHGHIEDTANKLAFGDDPDYWLITTLEKYNPDTGKYEKSDIMFKRTIMPNPKIERVSTASEALVVTLNEKGKIDIARMAQLTGKSESEIINDLKGIIFKNPANGAWETSDSYLSGNVREKLRQAEAAAENDPDYHVNVEALKKVQPKDLKAHEISVRLGANWIGEDTVRDFISELLETNDVSVRYVEQSGSWVLKAFPTNSALYANKYGTRRISAQNIIESLLNSRQINVYDTLEDKSKVLNKKETALAREKAEVIKREFAQWIYKNPERRQTLEQRYNEIFNNLRLRKYDGSFLTFPGMSAAITLRDYQKDAVARILFGGNTLLAHAVGAGKTFEMIAAGMELKRLHIAHKPMYVVPNHMIEQFRKDFIKLYPNANILAATKKDFEKERRARFISMIATGDWDAVIISHSSFGKIGVSKETQMSFILGEIEDVEAAIIAAREEGGKDPGNKRTVKELEAMKKRLEATYKSLLEAEEKDKYIDFEDLGVDYLFVDEAHNFKNLYFHTKMGRIAGVSNSKAKRAADMYMKVRYITGLHNNERGVVFATGTPISNSMPEMFTMQRYLAMPALERAGLKHFDAWAATFGEVVSSLEVDKTGRGFRSKQRFARFFNAPELVTMFRDFADVITSDMLNIERPTIEGGKPTIISVEPSPMLEQYIDELIERSEAVSSGMVDPTVDNALKITNDGRLAALDMRLIDPNLPDDPNSKLNRAVETIFQEWENGKAERTTQLVFSDLGTPKDSAASQEAQQDIAEEFDESAPEEEAAPSFAVSFDIYNDIKTKLVNMGVPEKEIAFIHDAKTDIAKDKLFEKVRRGEVRILMGSTAKMGEGTNVQDRLIALHHLDAPWKPSSVEQRNGRIIRSGNRHKQVRIYHYVTKGSFDAYIWQLIENKARFISQMMNNKMQGRQIEDAFDEVVLNSAEIKAAASQDPRILEKVKIDQEINRLELLKSSHMSQVYEAQDYITRMPTKIATSQQYLENVRKDIAKITDTKGDKFTIKLKGKTITERKKAGHIIINAAANAKFQQPVSIGSFSGFELLVDKDVSGDPRVVIRGANDYHVYTTATEVGTVTAIENAIRNLPKEENFAKEQLQKLKDRLESYKELANKPFEHEEQLQELYKKQAEINNALNLDVTDDVFIDEPEDDGGDYSDIEDPQAASRRASSGVQARSAAATVNAFAEKIEDADKKAGPVSRSELVDFVAEYFDIPIKQGNFREKALGIYKKHPEVIRLKNGKDFDTMFHEVGHHLDKKLQLVDGKTPMEIPDLFVELYALGAPASKPNYSEAQIMDEGIAEFVRIFAEDPERAKQIAPKFYSQFIKKVAAVPGLKDFFETVKAAHDNYINQTPEKRILGNVSKGSKKPGFSLAKTWEKFYTNAVEDIYPLYKAVKGITGGVEISADKNPYIWARLAAGASGKAQGIIKFGAEDKDGNKISKGLETILKPVQDRMDDFRAYAISKRAIELHELGIETGLNDADVRYVANKYEKEFAPILEEVVDFQNKVMHQLVYSGILSESDYKRITGKYEYYIPFQRVLEATEARSKNKGYQAYDPVKRIRGSTRDIIDPIESIIKNTFIFTEMAFRNMVGRTLVELAEMFEGSGKFIEKLPPKMMPKSFILASIKNILNAAGVDFSQADLQTVATIFTPSGYSAKDNVITVFREGNPEYYQVHEPDLYAALTALNRKSPNEWIRKLGVAARALRTGATGLNIDFIGRNIFKDTLFAAMTSKYWFIPGWDSAKGLWHVIRKDDIYKKWMSSGGANSDILVLDRDNIRRAYRDLLNKDLKSKTLNIIRHPIDFIRLWSEYTEQATRVGVFAKYLKHEGDTVAGRMIAALASRENTADFLRSGKNARDTGANQIIAFFNSGIQGTDAWIRAAKRDKGLFFLRGILYIAIPSIFFYLINKDDEEYEEFQQYEKDMFWMFKVRNTWYRIPTPYDLGMLFGALPVRMLRYWEENDPRAFEGWAKQFLEVVTPDVIPTIVGPALEVSYNYDPFRDKRIVPDSMKHREPKDQYNSFTSGLAIALGKLLNVSPMQIDYLIQGYTGGLGKDVARATGKVLEKVGVIDERIEPAESASRKIPLLKGLTTEAFRDPKSVDDFYKELNRLETDYKRARENEGIELDQYKDKKRLRQLRKAEDKLADLRKQYYEIYDDNTIDAKTKRQKLGEINIEMINVAREALGKPKIIR